MWEQLSKKVGEVAMAIMSLTSDAAYLPTTCALMGRGRPEPSEVGLYLKAPLAELNSLPVLGYY